MLSERTYMRQDYGRQPTPVVFWIISALISGFVLQNVFDRFLGSNSFTTFFALSATGVRHGYVWGLLTYTLLHDGILHLLFNGLGIFFLGRELTPLLGARRLVAVYLAAAAAGGLFWLAVHFFSGGTVLIGASGCVAGLFIVFACFYPDREVTFLLFFVLPVTLKPKVLAWILLGVDLLGFLFSELPGGVYDTGIAHSAHLGGMLAGWIYFRYFHANNGWDRAPSVSVALPGWLRRKAGRASAVIAPVLRSKRHHDLRAQVDRILDKINSQGFSALTEEEKRTLDEAKDLLSRK
ncbi:MAG: rhomboid family intramembrane serine protease [Opitutae bacterium]|nr:rhomboid family intramembrane serine protease [Opitutae bacterium]